MKGKRYAEEFKVKVVKQVTERGYSMADVTQRLGITNHSLYARLKSDLKRMTEECCIDRLNLQQSTLPATPSGVLLYPRSSN
jgi:transposase